MEEYKVLIARVVMGSGKSKQDKVKGAVKETKKGFYSYVRQKTRIRESSISDEPHHQPGNNGGGEG